MPSLIGGIFCRGATRTGALSGLMAGFCLWAYTLFVPSFDGELLLSTSVLDNGPLNISALAPPVLTRANRPRSSGARPRLELRGELPALLSNF